MSGPHKILLIEDNENVRENTAEILELAGYVVHTAENGKRGVELAKSQPFDLIICDIMMPELDGYGVLHILNKFPSTSTVPFIFLTAKAEKADFRKGMNLGADDYVTKPFDERELLEVVELRLKKSRQQDSPEPGTPADQSLGHLLSGRDKKLYRKKESIYRVGEFARSVFHIVSGKVKLIRVSDQGKEFITSLLGPGEFFGFMPLLDEQVQPEEATAIEDTEVVAIPAEEFKKLIYNERVIANSFIKLLSRNSLDQEERLLKLAYGNTRERVAHVLMHLHDKYGAEGQQLGVQFSREELAGYTGVATESLIRTLSEFKAEQIIQTDGKSLAILKPEKLKRIAEGRH